MRTIIVSIAAIVFTSAAPACLAQQTQTVPENSAQADYVIFPKPVQEARTASQPSHNSRGARPGDAPRADQADLDDWIPPPDDGMKPTYFGH